MPATSAEPFAFFNEATFNAVEAERFAPIAARQQQHQQQDLVLQQQRLMHHRTIGAVPLPPTTASQDPAASAAGTSSAADTTATTSATTAGCPASLGTTGAAGGWIPATRPALDPARHDISVHALPDAAYLEACIIPLLIPALQETARATPVDPISFLAAFLLSNNPQRDEDIQQRQTQITQGLATTPMAGAASGNLAGTQQQLSQHLFAGVPNDGLGPQHPVLLGRLLAPTTLMKHHGKPLQALDGDGLLSTAHLQQTATAQVAPVESSSSTPAASAPAPMDIRRHRSQVMQGAIEKAVASLSGRAPPNHATPTSPETTTSTQATGGGGPAGANASGRRASTPPTYPGDRQKK